MINLGLSRIRALLISRPKWLAIHIAGTNGKGSVAAYISSILHHQGISVGRFTSPHLIDRWDGISVNQQTVDEAVFRHVEADVLRKSRSFTKSAGRDAVIEPTEFEILTATAFEIFNRAKVQVGVIEVGLGGRLDATNVLEPGEVGVSVITRVGMDHEAFLGRTLEEIGAQKAGICKAGVPVVVDGGNEEVVVRVVEEEAKRVHAASVDLVDDKVVQRMLEDMEDVQLMPHQRRNLGVAVSAVRLVADELGVDEEKVAASLPVVVADVKRNWLGRLQWLSLQKVTGMKEDVLLDGAHNPQSARVLAEYVDGYLRKDGKPIMWIVAFTKGKDVAGIIDGMVRKDDIFVSTKFGAVDGMPWVENELREVVGREAARICDNVFRFQYSWEAVQTKDYILRRLRKGPEQRGGRAVLPEGNPDRSGYLHGHPNRAGSTPNSDQSGKSVEEPSHIVIAGSLYLVGDILRMVRDPPTSRREGAYKAWTIKQEKDYAHREKDRQQAILKTRDNNMKQADGMWRQDIQMSPVETDQKSSNTIT